MVRWDAEKEELLFAIVDKEEDVGDGLKEAARVLKTTFYVVRNRWYHPNLKEIRKAAKEAAKQAKPDILSMELELGMESMQVTPDPEIKVRAPMPNKVHSAVQILHEAIEAETQGLRDEINSLRKTHETLQEKFNELLGEYTAIHRVIAIARDLSVKEQLGEKTEVRFKMERNGNLETVKERYLGRTADGV